MVPLRERPESRECGRFCERRMEKLETRLGAASILFRKVLDVKERERLP
jgi:hypothetical protein